MLTDLATEFVSYNMRQNDGLTYPGKAVIDHSVKMTGRSLTVAEIEEVIDLVFCVNQELLPHINYQISDYYAYPYHCIYKRDLELDPDEGNSVSPEIQMLVPLQYNNEIGTLALTKWFFSMADDEKLLSLSRVLCGQDF
jgi:hypothetical protein